MPKKVCVAMSGGVDSSVAAALLVSRGFSVEGVTMRLWGDADRDIADAARVADFLGFPHIVLDLRPAFRAQVVTPFVGAYLGGLTPNPCVVCNREIKFGALYTYARERGCDFLSTGHYARVTLFDGAYLIARGRYPRKDQSYVLYHLPPEVRARILLPLGTLSKPQVRRLAREWALPVAARPDSQDICFIPDGDYADFVEREAALSVRPGDLLDTAGAVVGRHQGFWRYTVGQRRGFSGGFPDGPRFVLSTDPARNTVTVGKNDEVFSERLTVRGLVWATDRHGSRLDTKIRYSARAAASAVTQTGPDSAEVVFDAPQRAVTPGQSAVFYDGDRVVGGGTIVRASV